VECIWRGAPGLRRALSWCGEPEFSAYADELEIGGFRLQLGRSDSCSQREPTYGRCEILFKATKKIGCSPDMFLCCRHLETDSG
jgi:hypothetical protein